MCHCAKMVTASTENKRKTNKKSVWKQRCDAVNSNMMLLTILEPIQFPHQQTFCST